MLKRIAVFTALILGYAFAGVALSTGSVTATVATAVVSD